MPSTAELLSDPHYLLHRVDPAAGRLFFLPTDRQILRGATFLDGRTPIATARPISCSIDAALAELDGVEVETPRYIFHVSFCGSTLLSRLLDRPGKTLVLREPNILVELADWKTAAARQGVTDSRLPALIRLATATLHRRFEPDEVVAVKPSNWVNNLLPELCAAPALPFFIDMDQRAFLRAVFRGGRERIAFTARVAAHLAGGPDQPLLREAAEDSSVPLGAAARLAILAHQLQQDRFRTVMAQHGWGHDRLTSFEAISANPLAVASVAGAALALDLDPTDIAAGVTANSRRNAKAPQAGFSTSDQQAADAEIERLHGFLFDRATEWIDDRLSRPE